MRGGLNMQRLERKNDLDWLVKWKDQQIIKVVTGVRRCGKSTLFAIYQDYLAGAGRRAAADHRHQFRGP